jgi:hypothetical protein
MADNPLISTMRATRPAAGPTHSFFKDLNSSWTSFVDEVKRCFRGSAETAEPGRGDYLANPFFA